MADDALECSLESQTGMLDEDQMLVCAAQVDTEAAGRLYDKYYGEVLAYMYHCTLDRTAAEDLTSNVFLAVFGHLGRYRARRIPFRAWLYRIATNEIRMHYRRAKRIRALHLKAGTGECDAAPPASNEPAAAEQHRLLHKALLQLKLKYRTVIILRYFEDKTIAEISEITARRPGTVKSQLHRGLVHLQGILLHWGALPQSWETEP